MAAVLTIGRPGDGATLLDSHITIVNAAVGVDGRRGALGRC